MNSVSKKPDGADLPLAIASVHASGFPAADGGRKGSAFPDITAVKDGRTLRINTVDTRVSGRMTGREARNAAKIRALRPNDHLITIPKRPK